MPEPDLSSIPSYSDGQVSAKVGVSLAFCQEMTSAYTLAIMGEKALAMASQTCSWVIPGSKLRWVGHAERTGGKAFAASFFIRIEIVCQGG